MNDQDLKATHDHLDRVILKCAEELADPDSTNEIGKEKDISFVMAAAADTKWHLDEPPQDYVRLHGDRARQIIVDLRRQASELEGKAKHYLLNLAEEVAGDFDLDDIVEDIASENSETGGKSLSLEVEEDVSAAEEVELAAEGSGYVDMPDFLHDFLEVKRFDEEMKKNICKWEWSQTTNELKLYYSGRSGYERFQGVNP